MIKKSYFEIMKKIISFFFFTFEIIQIAKIYGVLTFFFGLFGTIAMAKLNLKSSII